MKVYLLEEQVDYDGSYFCSVHLSLEGAKKVGLKLAERDGNVTNDWKLIHDNIYVLDSKKYSRWTIEEIDLQE